VDVADLGVLVGAVRRALATPRRMYLVNATSHIALGWRDSVPRFELAGDPPLAETVRNAAGALGIDVLWESPADIVPPPAGWEERSRPVEAAALGNEPPLELRHFDPYSVVLRLIARGDEPDYLNALEFLRHGWVAMPRLEGLIAEMLPSMNSGTLAQDPAEFRRKFKGLRQVWASEAARAEALGYSAASWS
jgi:hypothetical protein